MLQYIYIFTEWCDSIINSEYWLILLLLYKPRYSFQHCWFLVLSVGMMHTVPTYCHLSAPRTSDDFRWHEGMVILAKKQSLSYILYRICFWGYSFTYFFLALMRHKDMWHDWSWIVSLCRSKLKVWWNERFSCKMLFPQMNSFSYFLYH